MCKAGAEAAECLLGCGCVRECSRPLLSYEHALIQEYERLVAAVCLAC